MVIHPKHPRPVVNVAQTMAKELGHTWGDTDLGTHQELSCKDIALLSTEQIVKGRDEYFGIAAPTLHVDYHNYGYGVVGLQHTTTTKGLSYGIYPALSGGMYITVEIHRPYDLTPLKAELRVWVEETVKLVDNEFVPASQVRSSVNVSFDGSQFYQRHVDKLADYVRVLAESAMEEVYFHSDQKGKTEWIHAQHKYSEIVASVREQCLPKMSS